VRWKAGRVRGKKETVAEKPQPSKHGFGVAKRPGAAPVGKGEKKAENLVCPMGPIGESPPQPVWKSPTPPGGFFKQGGYIEFFFGRPIGPSVGGCTRTGFQHPPPPFFCPNRLLNKKGSAPQREKSPPLKPGNKKKGFPGVHPKKRPQNVTVFWNWCGRLSSKVVGWDPKKRFFFEKPESQKI